MATFSRFFAVLLAIALAVIPAAAADAGSSSPGNSPTTLIRVLVSKGILTEKEAASLSASAGDQQQAQLVNLLLKKGVLTAADVQNMQSADTPPPAVLARSVSVTPAAVVKPAVLVESSPSPAAEPAPPDPKEPAVIPAVAPLRVLQTEPTKPGGLIPDVKLGSKVNMKIYGFLKASAIYDSSAPSGTDMPLPGFSTDTGPDGSSEFHIKARFARIGANFEFPDISPQVVLTGKLEADFEGNYTRVLNRNISTSRSSQFSIRLAYGRVDYRFNDQTNFFALLGEDWTPFGSSTLPNLYETTGLGLGFGTLYERAPQFRFGVGHKISGSSLFIQPEFALVLPAYGDDPAVLDNQLGYGERQGADSTRPDISGRLVTQWQLDKAKGVVPAQLIFSFVEGRRASEVPRGNIPEALRASFPNGLEASSHRWGWSGEVQLPTRYVTLLAKYWRGGDLRFFFVGDLLSFYNDAPLNPPAGTTVTYVPTIDGPATCPVAPAAAARNTGCVALITTGGVTTVAPQRPFRDTGYFVNLGFPLGRIFHADPASRNAGWQLYLHYAYDENYTREIARFGNLPDRNDLAAATLVYKLNSLVSFTWEQSMYRTRTVGPPGIPGFAAPLYRGQQATNWHDNRTEVGTNFTF